ncbi:Bax inhibitor-1/YccA family protein [Capnocytophaga canimorsus]|nr:Bax inhibitor-1/YccA family protein [Capnocytophaga canimorsus]WGU69697.1 Bax inhibitor-1/YccA family protein [Capnocytophaga canimorsus]
MLATFSVFLALLLVYRTGIIKVTQKFRMIVVGATAGIALFYLLGFVLSFFSVQMPLIHDSSIFGIGFSVVVVIIASLNLVLDFDFIEKASNGGAPKYMEWYAGFSLMITLVWLYIEILRLLSKLRD